MNNLIHVSQNRFFSSPMKFLRENSTYQKNVVFIHSRRRAKNFLLYAKKITRVVEILFYKSRGTLCGKCFWEHFFLSSDIESKCFCFCCKNFQEARQNSIPSVPMKTFVEIFRQKSTVFHHCRKFRWIFSAFRWKKFTCNVKTAFWVFRGFFCGKCFFSG